jgi:hypothetical protein
MKNLRFAIFNLDQQGRMTLAHQTLFEKEKEAIAAINTQILPEYDAAQRLALHNDLKLHTIGQSPNATQISEIKARLATEEGSEVTLNTVNLVVLPVTDIITLNFTVNKTTLAEIEKSPLTPSDAVQKLTLVANDVAESEADADAKGVKVSEVTE